MNNGLALKVFFFNLQNFVNIAPFTFTDEMTVILNLFPFILCKLSKNFPLFWSFWTFILKFKYSARRVTCINMLFFPLSILPSTFQNMLTMKMQSSIQHQEVFFLFSSSPFTPPPFLKFNFWKFLFCALSCSGNPLSQILNILASSSPLIFSTWFLCLQIYYASWRHFLNLKSLIWCIFFYLILLFGYFGSLGFLFFSSPNTYSPLLFWSSLLFVLNALLPWLQ